MEHLHPHRTDDDQLFQKYLDRAITDIHALGDDIHACGSCEHDHTDQRVLGTGHPLADVMLVKWAPTHEELDHGVAFFGRAGEAVRLSMERLSIDPLDLYGTNCIKCATVATSCQRASCGEWLHREIRIVEPRLLVIMGRDALAVVNELNVPDSAQLLDEPGNVQRWTHACDAIVCPDIDASLDRPVSKRAFWRAFRALGDWYADKPPF